MRTAPDSLGVLGVTVKSDGRTEDACRFHRKTAGLRMG